MKTYLKIIIITLAAIFSTSAFAASPKKYFDSLSSDANFDYSYVSPYMLKAMGGQYIDGGGLSISADDITSIETISTFSDGSSDEFWDIIRKVKKENDMETLSTKKQGYYRYDVLGKLSDNGKVLTNLLVITQNTGSKVTVVYIVGKIPMDVIGLQFR